MIIINTVAATAAAAATRIISKHIRCIGYELSNRQSIVILFNDKRDVRINYAINHNRFCGLEDDVLARIFNIVII